MERTILTQFNVGDRVIANFGNGLTYKGRIYMIKAEWDKSGVSISYDVETDKNGTLTGISVKNISRLDVISEAREKLSKMSLDECIKMWNESASDHYRKTYEIHDIDNEDWWNFIAKEIGAFWVARNLTESGDNFNFTDHLFFYDIEAGQFHSFSTKAEMIEILGDDFFIDELISRK